MAHGFEELTSPALRACALWGMSHPSGASLCLCLVYVCRTCLQDFSSLGVWTQDLVCKTQKLPLGGFVMGRGVGSVTAEPSGEDLLKGRWVWPGLEEPEGAFQVR